MAADVIVRERKTHIWPRDPDEWYREPAWCSERLFAAERFEGLVLDPCCGAGTIVDAARRAGLRATGADLVDRGYPGTVVRDFFTTDDRYSNIVCNPPFDIAREFTRHALNRAEKKVAIILPLARLNAAHWLQETPLRRVWLLTPRPSMPPGRVIAAGQKAQGGRADFCWLVFDQGHVGGTEINWLHRH